ncbi:hypothetical protein [Paenibacillus caseinilyticus]|nr:hypothetical protein [Paenibacillus caseinilyticus]
MSTMWKKETRPPRLAAASHAALESGEAGSAGRQPLGCPPGE